MRRSLYYMQVESLALSVSVGEFSLIICTSLCHNCITEKEQIVLFLSFSHFILSVSTPWNSVSLINLSGSYSEEDKPKDNQEISKEGLFKLLLIGPNCLEMLMLQQSYMF